jgi:serine phosphatase RsbU (regulator of sigma subunit)/tetratricopeptide (TPR) repeat protein
MSNPAMKSYFIGLLFFTCQLVAIAQNSKADSLRTLLKSDKQDTNKVNHYIALAKLLAYTNPDTSIILGNQALKLAENISWRKGISTSLGQLGVFNYIKGDFSLALDLYTRALKLDEELENKNGIVKHLGNIGVIFLYQGDYPKALDYLLKALKIAEELNNKQLQANNLGNIGGIYIQQGDYPKALDYLLKALKINEDLGNKNSIAAYLGNIGGIYNQQKNFDKALEYYFKALKLKEELGDINEISITLGNIGSTYAERKDYPRALDYYFQALKMKEDFGNKHEIAITLGNIGSVYSFMIASAPLDKKKDVADKAEKYLLDAIKLDKEIGALDYEMQFEKTLSDLYSQTNRHQLSLEHYKNAMVLKDSIFSQENKKQLVQKEMTFDFEKKEAIAMAKHEKELENQKVITGAVVAGLVLVVVFAVFILISLRVTRKQKEIIEAQKTEVESSKFIIEEKNKDITDSINYAKRIQQAKLPDKKEIASALPQSFVLFKPKDIVSGDFYFFSRKDQDIFLAAADCTGHGVPGAFMSLIGSERLEDAVLQNSDTSEILKQLNRGVKASLRQTDSDVSTRDGMDIALCAVNTKNRIIKYAGANRPLWIIRNGQTVMEEIKPTKKAIGGFTEDNQYFDSHEIKLQQGDTFYICTDGYADQFSGQRGKKLMTKKFKEILIGIQDKSMESQEKHLNDFIEDWKSGTEQVDDILVIGVRI